MNKRAVSLIFRYIGYVTLVIAFLMATVLSYWNVENPTVLSVVTTPFPVRPPQNTAGNIEYVHVNYCKNTNSVGTIILKMVGTKSQIRLSFTDRDTSNAMCVNTEVPVVLPTYAVDDTYYFEFDIVYQINPIKTKAVVLKSEKFTIKSDGIIKILDSSPR